MNSITNTNCRILLVEDDPSDAHLVRSALRTVRELCFEVTWAISLTEAQQALNETSVDLLLLDLSLPDAVGLETVKMGRKIAKMLPIIVLTGHDDTSFALKALEAGAQDYIIKGHFDTDSLVRAIRYAISRAKLEQRLHESEQRDKLLVSALKAVGHGVIITDIQGEIEWVNPAFERLTGYSVAEALGKKPTDLVKSGQQTKEFYEGLWQKILNGENWTGELINKRKDQSLYNEELSITPVTDENGVICHFVGIKQDITERIQMREQLWEMATTDFLTGIMNRRYFMSELEKEFARVLRFDRHDVAVLMLDIDHFKRVNDTYGHAIGDALLKHFILVIQQHLRKTDLVGRLGGEEFSIVLPDTPLVAAKVFAERLCNDVKNNPLPLGDVAVAITVSIGLTIMETNDNNCDAVLIRADDALYRAKELGRNRVEVSI
jgi:two-component system, cell cycle response regulator